MDADGSSVLGRAGSWSRRVLKILARRSMPSGMQTSPAPEGYRPARCPECAALVRGDVPWCTACYVRLDGPPAGEPVTAPPAEPVAAPPAEPGTAPGAQVAHPDSADPEDVDAVAARLLAELAATGEQPGWTGWLPRTRAGRTAAVAALLAGCSAVLLAAMTLVGLVL